MSQKVAAKFVVFKQRRAISNLRFLYYFSKFATEEFDLDQKSGNNDLHSPCIAILILATLLDIDHRYAYLYQKQIQSATLAGAVENEL